MILDARQRHLITIGREDIIDLDFSAMHERLAYLKIVDGLPQGDACDVPCLQQHRAVQLCGLRDATMKRNDAIQRKANAEAQKVCKIIGPMREAGKTLANIAEAINEMEVATSRGGSWTPMQVKRVLDRAS